MSTYDTGSVVLVNFPFTDLLSFKVRPALVLTSQGEDVIILGIFSKIPDTLKGSWILIDEALHDFGTTGLKKSSIIKTEKITVIHNSLIKKKIGYLSHAWLAMVRKTLLKTLKLE
jgi:mRNA interferase MazF